MSQPSPDKSLSKRQSHSYDRVREESALHLNLLETVFLQSSHDRLLKMQAYQLFINATLIILTTLAVFLLLGRPVERAYFIVNEDGQVVTQIDMLTDPIISSSKARSFADDCVRKVLNIDFVHYKGQLSNAETCFTRAGFVQFVSLLQRQGILAEISQGYSVASVAPKQANFLKSSGAHKGKQRWRVKGSYLWSLQQGTKTTQYPLDIEISLVAMELNESVHGMAIDMLQITRG